MNALTVYQTFAALRLHFDQSQKYDYSKYGPLKSITQSKLDTNKHRFLFEKVARQPEPLMLMVFACSDFRNPAKWIGAVMEHEEDYISWCKHRDMFRRWFTTETKTLLETESFDILCSAQDGQPKLARLYFSGELPLYYLLSFNKTMVEFVSYWETVSDPLVKTLAYIVKASECFFEDQLDWPALRAIGKEILAETSCSR